MADRLELEALGSSHGCWAITPGDEPESEREIKEFFRVNGQREIDEQVYDLSLVRLSLYAQQPFGGVGALHLDGVDPTGLVDDGVPKGSKIHRLVVNLHLLLRRDVRFCWPDEELTYVDQGSGFVTCNDYDPEKAIILGLKERVGKQATGLEFCASEVLHAGIDGPDGHFVALYHRIEV